jgi:hypothetical protein
VFLFQNYGRRPKSTSNAVTNRLNLGSTADPQETLTKTAEKNKATHRIHKTARIKNNADRAAQNSRDEPGVEEAPNKSPKNHRSSAAPERSAAANTPPPKKKQIRRDQIVLDRRLKKRRESP